jgi:hypothetical protein
VLRRAGQEGQFELSVWTDHESVLEEVRETFHEVIVHDRWHATRDPAKAKEAKDALAAHKEEHKHARRYVGAAAAALCLVRNHVTRARSPMRRLR